MGIHKFFKYNINKDKCLGGKFINKSMRNSKRSSEQNLERKSIFGNNLENILKKI